MDKVSVVVPVYNVGKYLEECLDSIIGQTYKELEIIIINDGSTDNSLSICKQYSKKDSRIKLINQKNMGVSKTRNRGISEATGKYITFVDSDDYLELNMIETAISEVEEDALIVWGYSEVYKNKIISNVLDLKISKENLSETFGSTLIGSSCNKLFSLQKIKNNKLFFYDDIYNCEDLLFVLTYLQYVEKIKYKNIVLYNHRIEKNVLMFYKKPTLRNMTILNAYEKILELPIADDKLLNKIKYEYVVAYYRMKKYIPKDFRINKDILKYRFKILNSQELTLKEKIKYVIIKYFNGIYQRYSLNKVNEENLY